MAIVEGISDLTLFVFLLVLLALGWMIKVASDLRLLISKRARAIDGKVSLLEGKAVLMRREVVDLHKAMHQKLDKSEFERRMDGLVELISGKKPAHKKKDVA